MDLSVGRVWLYICLLISGPTVIVNESPVNQFHKQINQATNHKTNKRKKNCRFKKLNENMNMVGLHCALAQKIQSNLYFWIVKSSSSLYKTLREWELGANQNQSNRQLNKQTIQYCECWWEEEEEEERMECNLWAISRSHHTHSSLKIISKCIHWNVRINDLIN